VEARWNFAGDAAEFSLRNDSRASRKRIILSKLSALAQSIGYFFVNVQPMAERQKVA
jgi:cyanate permease